MLIEIRGGPHAIPEFDTEDTPCFLRRFLHDDGTIGYYYVFVGYNERGHPIFQYSAKDGHHVLH